jgi:hypothetical protein
LEKDNYNNVPKRAKLNAERQREYRETHKNISAENTHNYRKRKAQEIAQENKTSQASTSTDPTPTPIIHSYDQASEYFQRILLVIHLVMPATNVIDYGV